MNKLLIWVIRKITMAEEKEKFKAMWDNMTEREREFYVINHSCSGLAGEEL
jgi:hypothetical protein